VASVNRTPLLLGLLMLGAVFAGCLSNDTLDLENEGSNAAEKVSEWRPSGDLFGWIVDPAFEPVPQVNLTIVGVPVGTAVSTNESGFFSFPSLPRGEDLVVIAQHGSFLTQSKRVLLPTEGSIRLNFTLEPRPVKTPWDEVLDFRGLIACQAVVEHDEGHLMTMGGPPGGAEDLLVSGLLDRYGGDPSLWRQTQRDGEHVLVDCGTLDPNNAALWEFRVAPELAGVIVEVSWESTTELASVLRLTLEIAGTGTDDMVLAQAVGPNVLMAQVNNHQAQRYFQDGGHIRAVVEVDANVHDEETGTGVAFAYQQDFHIHATAFYVDPPPATYSIHS
jgi:hypothetical protein